MPILGYPMCETKGADITLTAVVEFDPDTHEPKTIKQLADEQRAFIAECDQEWEEAFATTTDEEFDRLEEHFKQDIAEHGTTPLDFTGR